MSAEILIIDDNADIRLILDELIKDSGYKTRVAANFNQALAEIDKKLPDVAIIDVKLDKGDNDGIELLSHIKSKNNDELKIGDKIFEPKFTTKTSGMGLGLGIVKKIIESHKGSIEYISKNRKGTTFTITLPNFGD